MRLNNSRYILKYLVILLTFFLLWPIYILLREGLYGIQKGSIYLTIANLNEIKGTLLLLIFSLTLGGFLGIANGWILANCHFKGRKTLTICQLIPFATPAYLLAATFIDLGSINSIRITGMFWGVINNCFLLAEGSNSFLPQKEAIASFRGRKQLLPSAKGSNCLLSPKELVLRGKKQLLPSAEESNCFLPPKQLVPFARNRFPPPSPCGR